MEATAAKVSDVTNTRQAQPGTNEFFGIAHRYGVMSDSGSILAPGISGCEITRLGPMCLPTRSSQVTEWDRHFFAGLPHLFAIQADMARLFADVCTQQLSLREKPKQTYEEWLQTVHI